MASAYNLYTTANAPQFKARVEMVLTRHALTVMAMNPPPTDGSLLIAQHVLGTVSGGSDLTARMAKFICSDATYQTAASTDVSGADVTDANLLAAVETHFLKLG